MKFWTSLEMKTKIEADLDIEGESFVSDAEFLGYANEAIDEIEKNIHDLCEDYFLTRGSITLASGTEEYALPDDIFAMKIRGIVYRNGTTVWPVERVRDWKKFEQYEAQKASTGASYKYGFFIINSTPGSPKLLISPTPNENGAYLKFWYLRNANRLTADSSICDIPEAANTIMQYIKVKCMEKELHPNLLKAAEDLEKQKALMLENLADMVQDNQNDIEADTRLYEEMT